MKVELGSVSKNLRPMRDTGHSLFYLLDKSPGSMIHLMEVSFLQSTEGRISNNLDQHGSLSISPFSLIGRVLKKYK